MFFLKQKHLFAVAVYVSTESVHEGTMNARLHQSYWDREWKIVPAWERSSWFLLKGALILSIDLTFAFYGEHFIYNTLRTFESVCFKVVRVSSYNAIVWHLQTFRQGNVMCEPYILSRTGKIFFSDTQLWRKVTKAPTKINRDSLTLRMFCRGGYAPASSFD